MWLAETRGVAGVGTECPSLEVDDQGHRAALALARAGAFTLLQLRDLSGIPVLGSASLVAPLSLAEGVGGGPARVVNFPNGRMERTTSSAGRSSRIFNFFSIFSIMIFSMRI